MRREAESVLQSQRAGRARLGGGRCRCVGARLRAIQRACRVSLRLPVGLGRGLASPHVSAVVVRSVGVRCLDEKV